MIGPILAIVGPTASGKTELALRLAWEENGELISADSRQVYRYLSVGTAKPQGIWQGSVYRVDRIPYHLVDICDPTETFSAAEFARQATQLIGEIRARDKTPIIVGGTGFYLKALTEGLAPLPPANLTLRERLKAEAERSGRAALHAKLAAVDPVAAEKIPANNIQRLIRALEVHELTGIPLSEWHATHQRDMKRSGDTWTLRCIGIEHSKEALIKRIEERCHAMVEGGMIQETELLVKKGYKASCPALSGLGYPHVMAHLSSKISKAALLRNLIQDTRQYAKRQLTWFRHQMEVEWKTL